APPNPFETAPQSTPAPAVTTATLPSKRNKSNDFNGLPFLQKNAESRWGASSATWRHKGFHGITRSIRVQLWERKAFAHKHLDCDLPRLAVHWRNTATRRCR